MASDQPAQLSTTLEDARRVAREQACPGCGKAGARKAFEVNNGGPNQGRLFLKCAGCGHFAWASPPRVADAELAAAQATAGPCPRCGKGRQALRVQKDGPNKGRLFLRCDDRACDSFEWASPPPAGLPSTPAEGPDQTAPARPV